MSPNFYAATYIIYSHFLEFRENSIILHIVTVRFARRTKRISQSPDRNAGLCWPAFFLLAEMIFYPETISCGIPTLN